MDSHAADLPLPVALYEEERVPREPNSFFPYGGERVAGRLSATAMKSRGIEEAR
jgi:hypothetical protein